MRPLLYLFLFFIIGGIQPVPLVSAGEEIVLDGVSYDASRPEATVAIVNGEIRQTGDTVQGFEIVSIFQGGITLRNLKTGQERTVKVEDKVTASQEREKEPEARPPGVTQEPEGTEAAMKAVRERREQEKDGTPASWFSQLAQSFSNAGHFSVILDLKKVHMAAMIYESTYEPGNFTVNDLVQKDLLPPSFTDGKKGNYVFTLQSIGMGPAVAADPVKPDASAYHFLIDAHGAVYQEQGKPATRTSKIFS